MINLKKKLEKNNITNYKYTLEFEPDNKINLPIKQALNSQAGVYLCINLVKGKTYVGSASKNGMYRRYSSGGHLLNCVGGSAVVKRAVKNYGLENFAFVVLETVDNAKEQILSP